MTASSRLRHHAIKGLALHVRSKTRVAQEKCLSNQMHKHMMFWEALATHQFKELDVAQTIVKHLKNCILRHIAAMRASNTKII